MNQYIDIYCERLNPGLWAEPLNAASNLAFFLAAYFVYRLAAKSGKRDPATLTLMGLLMTIGLGSTLFHTFAVRWAMLADTLPILLYQVAFLILYSRDVMKWPTRYNAMLLTLFFIMTAAFAQFPQSWLNGSLNYGTAAIFLLGFGLWHYKNREKEKPVLLAAAGIFVLSLTFRSSDMAICNAFPLGVHYFWHILNGLVLYLTARAYINAK